jgi:hypothetical protein
LDAAWQETVLTLRGAKKINPDLELGEIWEECCDGGFYPEKWARLIVQDDVLSIINNNKLTKGTLRTIYDLIKSEQGDIAFNRKEELCQLLIESYFINAKKITSEYLNRPINTGRNGVKWIQVGNVFVTFFQKGEAGDIKEEPRAIWARLKEALVSWNPSYYRVILSEVQNNLEEQSLSMDKLAGKEIYEQSSVLWNIFSKIGSDGMDEAIRKTLENIYEYLSKSAISSDSLKKFVAEVAQTLYPKGAEGINIKNEELLGIVLKNYDQSIGQIKPEDHHYIIHALNKELSTIDVFSDYITTGTILKSEDREWYVCVSPSCNTVAGQNTGELSNRMKPHRFLRFIKLKKCSSLRDTLVKATESNFIFVNDGEGQRIALFAVAEKSKLPEMEVGIVLHHDKFKYNEE